MIQLLDIADVRAGQTFRGKVLPMVDGDVSVVQMRDLEGAGVNWSSVVVTALKSRKDPDWIRPSDILVPSVGARLRAVVAASAPSRAICTNHLFLIRPDASRVEPGFLAWLINQPVTQRQLATEATGGTVKLLRRAALQAIQLELPPLPVQQLIAELVEAQQQERRVLEQLIENREKQISALAQNLAAPEPRKGGWI
ncbi:restriction endonuclease subunit S [Maricaulis maris]|jgi:hypothetical protein|uniref:restriction endonuclease subunit S n=1 Tax=Maricaulis maris TaxID=74318 RepID=UPI0026F183D4|nr:restriction endonuclease subunit S [Maricaulis maris]